MIAKFRVDSTAMTECHRACETESKTAGPPRSAPRHLWRWFRERAECTCHEPTRTWARNLSGRRRKRLHWLAKFWKKFNLWFLQKKLTATPSATSRKSIFSPVIRSFSDAAPKPAINWHSSWRALATWLCLSYEHKWKSVKPLKRLSKRLSLPARNNQSKFREFDSRSVDWPLQATRTLLPGPSSARWCKPWNKFFQECSKKVP